MIIYSSSSQITPLFPLQIIWQASRVPFHAKLWLLNFDMRVENLDISIQQPEMKRCSVGIKCMRVYVVVCWGYLFVLCLFRYFCGFFVCVSLFFLVGEIPGSLGQYSFLTFIKIQDGFDRLKQKSVWHRRVFRCQWCCLIAVLKKKVWN